jgi:uncharacterized protein YfiM (DUF2279 family)
MNELVGTVLVWSALACSPAPVCDDAAVLRESANAHAQSVDAWLGADKFTHAAMSWAGAAFTFAAMRSVGAERDTSLEVAVPVALAAGAAKELFDHRRGGRFSVRDLVADAVGVGAAYFFLREVR